MEMNTVIEDRWRNNTMTLIRVRIGFRIASRSVGSPPSLFLSLSSFKQRAQAWLLFRAGRVGIINATKAMTLAVDRDRQLRGF